MNENKETAATILLYSFKKIGGFNKTQSKFSQEIFKLICSKQETNQNFNFSRGSGHGRSQDFFSGRGTLFQKNFQKILKKFSKNIQKNFKNIQKNFKKYSKNFEKIFKKKFKKFSKVFKNFLKKMAKNALF